MDDSPRPFSIADLDYTLPEALIAQSPPPRRGESRLLVLERATGRLHEQAIADLPEWLRAGDLLVFNDTRVIPARFTLRRATGGRIPGLFIEETRVGEWRVLLEGSRRLSIDEVLTFELGDSIQGTDTTKARLTSRFEEGVCALEISPAALAVDVLDRVGRTPLPPYIRRGDHADAADVDRDRERYQTVYARVAGAVAAPTAGLHFTRELIERVEAVGVSTAYLTLHVGIGTFKPIAVDDITRHAMHAERYTIGEDTARAVRLCRERGGRVVAVGTTSVRALESAAMDGRLVRSGHGHAELFIYPPRRLNVVDALLTNFHLPRSTLLALVMAFAGVESIRRAYEHAVAKKYRFFSYGDAMLIV